MIIDYNLVFVVMWRDVKLPLVLSQTFDQAESQGSLDGNLKPFTVAVWIVTPLRFVLDSNELSFVSSLRKRCPHVSIRIVPAISRLHYFPSSLFIRWYILYKRKSIFHFRGEDTFNFFTKVHKKKNEEYHVVDVRGYWPAEWLYQLGKESDNMSVDEQVVYNRAKKQLQQALERAGGIMTVSDNLADLLRETFHIPTKIQVTPCCVRSINDRLKRNDLRRKLQVQDQENLLVYSGGYAKYQHLEDLTLPFLSQLLELDKDVKVLILSQQMERIRTLIPHDSPYFNRFIFQQADQQDVADYLSACDLGFLLRRETLVNRVAQPVKVGEYLAAGVPICVEGEVGGVTDKLISYGAGISIQIDGKANDVWKEEARRVLDFLKASKSYFHNARRLARDHFLWESVIPTQRKFYSEILNVNK